MGILAGKRGLIFGVANKHSLAWSIAEVCHQEHATLGLSYVDDRMEKRIAPLREKVQPSICAPCNVAKPEEIEHFFSQVEAQMGAIDFLVHSLAFAERESLTAPFSETSLSAFETAMNVSCFSLVELVNRGRHLLSPNCSVVTLSFLGSQRYVHQYNVMGVAKAALESSVRYLAGELGQHGVRVNAVSAGPVKTLAASGIPGFKTLLKHNASRTALNRNVTAEEVGKAASFLCSDMSTGITGEILHVDCGAHFMDVPPVFAAQQTSKT